MSNKIFVFSIFAAIFFAFTPKSESKILNHAGAIRGGQVGGFVSLIDLIKVPQTSTKANHEKIAFSFGSQVFTRIDQLGYYQMEYREKDNQLILNFSRTLNSKIRQSDMQKKLAKSTFIKKVSMDFDRLGQSTILTFELKKKIKILTREISGNKNRKTTAGLLLELSESQIK